uniref:Uncharacterized protein n=1 Tax=Anguilla anguilla TaxID=7936 RepID=A0A0E9VMD1_ANGAN
MSATALLYAAPVHICGCLGPRIGVFIQAV